MRSLIVFCCALLFLRRPDGLLHAQFYAEDGWVFFKDAFQLGIWDAIKTPYAGYFHFIPRIIAAFSTLFPVSTIPTIYNAFSLLIAGICVSWFYLPHFRNIVKNDIVRLLCVLFLLFAPNQESLMKLSYIQWYLLLWATLATFMLPPRNWWIRGLILLGLIIIFWTSPVALILLPIWLLKLVCQKSRNEKLVAGFIVLVGIFCGISIAAISAPGNGATHFQLVSFIHAIIIAFYSRIILSPLLGSHLMYIIWTSGRHLFGITSIVLSLGLLIMFVRNRPKLFLNIALFYVAVASACALIMRQEAWQDFLSPGFLNNPEAMQEYAGRYFFLGTAMLYMFISVHIDRLLVRNALSYVRRGAVVLGLIAIISLSLLTLRMKPLVDMEWSRYGALIVSTEQSLGINESKTLEIPINPFGWPIELTVRGTRH